MTIIRVQRLTIQEQGTDAVGARRLARRVAELLGEALATSPAVHPRPQVIVDVPTRPDLTGDRLAAYIARQIRARLG